MATTKISDRDAIVEVVNRYSYSLDERDWDSLDQVFTADAVGRYGGQVLNGKAARHAVGDIAVLQPSSTANQ